MQMEYQRLQNEIYNFTEVFFFMSKAKKVGKAISIANTNAN